MNDDMCGTTSSSSSRRKRRRSESTGTGSAIQVAPSTTSGTRQSSSRHDQDPGQGHHHVGEHMNFSISSCSIAVSPGRIAAMEPVGTYTSYRGVPAPLSDRIQPRDLGVPYYGQDLSSIGLASMAKGLQGSACVSFSAFNLDPFFDEWFLSELQ